MKIQWLTAKEIAQSLGVGENTIWRYLSHIVREVAFLIMAQNTLPKETTGAWIIHHGQKLALDARGPSEFPLLDEAAKAASLLSQLGETEQATLSMEEVKAVAVSANLNPNYELKGLLKVLEEKRLIYTGEGGISILGVTTKGVLINAADLFLSNSPSPFELASITLAEKCSLEPTLVSDISEYISDHHKLASAETKEFIEQSLQLGFVDSEGDAAERLLFNGNLFKRDCIHKTSKVLSSLTQDEESKTVQFGQTLENQGCVQYAVAEQILGQSLFQKLIAAGIYELNVVSNDQGEHTFVTSPGAFHKFTDPLIDDCFDFAKALVAALTYGMTSRSSSQGRINMIDRLLRKLIVGNRVGPATAIGHDYRYLEQKRIVKIIPDGGLFHMQLLKKEVGELALQVLTTGNASETAIIKIQGAKMQGFKGPESNRVRIRKNQSAPSKRATQDVLSALRGGRTL